MAHKKVPDAWEDDWETQADKADQDGGAPIHEPPKTKAERLAEHRELNRQIWEAAETPSEPMFVAATSNVPLTQPFKPQMKLLSRKPPPKTVKTKDPVTGIEKLTIQDDGDDDDEEKPPQPTPEEIRERQQRDLEEKQRKYEEARAKIFGESASGLSSGASTPGTTTPPAEGSRGGYRGRGRGRGGRGGRGGQRSTENYNRSESQDRRPGNNSSPFRELFDPEAASRSGSRPQRGGGTSSPPRGPEQAIRSPRGPDNSGRGGFGFARRGAGEG
ncbi:hypothetical protein VPNG_01782 [Cytospora leucostoma]|uniref:Uncharacterized protein n=1 Tax=Cytospora leucostoma TaxID=1230097 RepID=A0A423XIE2_9PEZI|nr:hypothetical protein VPNG_01782 [Cytospora leucostoma]